MGFDGAVFIPEKAPVEASRGNRRRQSEWGHSGHQRRLTNPQWGRSSNSGKQRTFNPQDSEHYRAASPISIGVSYNGIIAVSKTEDVGSIPTAPAKFQYGGCVVIVAS